MSFLSAIETDVEKVGGVFKKLFKAAPTVGQNISLTIGLVAPTIETIIGLTAGATADTEATAIIKEVQNDLTLAATFAKTENNSKDVASALNGVVTDLPQLLQLASVKNSAKVADITASVDGVVGTLQGLITAINANVSA